MSTETRKKQEAKDQSRIIMEKDIGYYRVKSGIISLCIKKIAIGHNYGIVRIGKIRCKCSI